MIDRELRLTALTEMAESMNVSNWNIVFFEDSLAPQFFPVALLRPVFELVCGHGSVRERLRRRFPETEWGAILRPELRETYLETFPDCKIDNLNSLREAPTLIINGRWLGDPRTLEDLDEGTSGWIDDELAWSVFSPEDLQRSSDPSLADQVVEIAKSKRSVPTTGEMIHYPWDLIHFNPQMLSLDFDLNSRDEQQASFNISGLVGPREQLFIGQGAEVDPFVVLDTRHGPIWIESGAKLQAFTRIEGPAYVGRETQTFRANIREGTTIGPVCRVGGEVEESILHGFANKYHDGFLGHSYVCPWVNLGALTTNSDLKNDYSDVSVPLVGERVLSESNKVGCFIGDHTKTAIGSFFNTGSSIGVMSMVLPAGELQPKFVPSYSRVWHGQIEELPNGIDSAMKTARIAMDRRKQELTPAMQKLLQHTFEITQPHRDAALLRQSQRR